jgi:uncharacterized protein (TIGR03437 family)
MRRFVCAAGWIVVGLLLALDARAGANDPVRQVGVGLGKVPGGGSMLTSTTDANGSFSIVVPEAGVYKLFVMGGTGLRALPAGTAVRVTLQGGAVDQSAGKNPSRALMRGRGWELKKNHPSPMFRLVTPEGSLDLKQQMEIAGPMVVSGRLEVDRIITSVEHITFTAVSGGLTPPARTVEIVAEGIEGFSYAVQANGKMTARPAVSPSSGRSGNREIRISPPATSLSPGVYQGAVELTIIPDDGSGPIRHQIGITYDVRQPGNIDIVSDRRFFVLPALAPANRDGAPRLTTMSMTLTNPDTEEAVLRMGYEKPSDQAIFRFPQAIVRIPAGGTVRVPVEVNRDAYIAARGEKQCVIITKTLKDGSTSTVTLYYLPADTTGGTVKPQGFVTCRPSRIRPVLVRYPTTVWTGVPAEFEIEAIDDCGNPVSDFVATLTVAGGPPREYRAVTNKGISGYLVVPATDSSGTEAELEVEVSTGTLRGILTQGVTVRASTSQTPAALGAGRAVTSKSIGGYLVSPGDFVSVGVDLPDTPEQTAPGGGPLPTELGGFKVLLDGEPIEIASVSATELIARMPQPGRIAAIGGNHLISVMRDSAISAPVPLSSAERSPRVLTIAKLLANGTAQPLTPEVKAAAGDKIVLYATGMGAVEGAPPQNPAQAASGGYKVLAPVKIWIGGKEARTTSAIYRRYSNSDPIADDEAVVAGRSLDYVYVIEAEAPEGMQSHDPASGHVPVKVQAGDVASGELTGYADATPLSTVDFVTNTNAPGSYDGGPPEAGPVQRTETVDSAHSLTAPFLLDFGNGNRLERVGWYTSDPTGTNPPPDVSTDVYSFMIPAVPEGTLPVYGADYVLFSTLNATLDPAACMGTITMDPPSPDQTYADGPFVQLTATPAPGWTFSHWLGADPFGYVHAGGAATGVCVPADGLTLTTNIPNSNNSPNTTPKPGLTTGLPDRRRVLGIQRGFVARTDVGRPDREHVLRATGQSAVDVGAGHLYGDLRSGMCGGEPVSSAIFRGQCQPERQPLHREWRSGKLLCGWLHSNDHGCSQRRAVRDQLGAVASQFHRQPVATRHQRRHGSQSRGHDGCLRHRRLGYCQHQPRQHRSSRGSTRGGYGSQ